MPLYGVTDAKRAIAKITPIPPGRDIRLGQVRISLTPVGHLLGACAVTLRSGNETLIFSGDLGRDDDVLMPAPQTVSQADVLLIESGVPGRGHAWGEAGRGGQR